MSLASVINKAAPNSSDLKMERILHLPSLFLCESACECVRVVNYVQEIFVVHGGLTRALAILLLILFTPESPHM